MSHLAHAYQRLLVGGFAMGAIESTGVEELRKQFTLNFDTAYSVARVLYPHMKQNGYGRIVLVGARPALDANAGKNMLAYALSKSLLFKLAEFLNADSKGTNITTSVIVPSTIDTPANRTSMPTADFNNWVKPEAIAEAMEMICSERGNAWRETVIKMFNNA